ncbi:MAG: carboxylesterase/lipase family protein [Phenylobacterium sp.]
MHGFRRALAALTAFGALAAAPALAASDPQVTLDTGVVAGAAGGDVVSFKGIPFAAPPVGPLRWRAPQPAAHWSGVREAKAFGAACPQPHVTDQDWQQVGPTSEDCLFLNVYEPAGGRKNLPVMVFIHGGSFSLGSAGVHLFDGSNLARRGAVIVTVNYRLGRLGFFAHPALTREDPKGELGNYGLMDQFAAIRWVHRNIGKFGGDPANVTIFGESAGAGSVQLLMAWPGAKGLIAKAISESGAGGEPLSPIRGVANSPEAAGEKWTAGLGLHDLTAAQLRAIPLKDVVGAAGFPMIDGTDVRHAPGDNFNRGEVLKIPFIVGGNSYEESLAGFGPAAARLYLQSNYAAVLDAYKKRPGTSRAGAEQDLGGDVNVVLAARFLADMHVKAGAPKSYTYLFDQLPSDQRGKTPGVPHGGELEFVFGNPMDGHQFDATDRKVSQLMGDYWVRFARTGDPNGAGAPKWPAVTAGAEPYMRFEADSHAANATPLEEKVKGMTLEAAMKAWRATPSP